MLFPLHAAFEPTLPRWLSAGWKGDMLNITVIYSVNRHNLPLVSHATTYERGGWVMIVTFEGMKRDCFIRYQQNLISMERATYNTTLA